MALGPGLARPRVANPAAKQELGEPVASSHQIAAQVLAGPHQIAEALLLDAGHVGEGKLAGGKQSRQALGISAVGLHPVGRPTRDQARRGDA